MVEARALDDLLRNYTDLEKSRAPPRAGQGDAITQDDDELNRTSYAVRPGRPLFLARR
jgi:hypothetical protein